VGKFCDFWHNITLYLGNGTRYSLVLSLLRMNIRHHTQPDNCGMANDLERCLITPSSHFCKFWGPSFLQTHFLRRPSTAVFLFSKPIVSIRVCCSYIELPRSKRHMMGDLQVGNWQEAQLSPRNPRDALHQLKHRSTVVRTAQTDYVIAWGALSETVTFYCATCSFVHTPLH